MAPAAAEEELRRAGGGRVVAQRDRIGADRGDLACRVEPAPRLPWRRRARRSRPPRSTIERAPRRRAPRSGAASARSAIRPAPAHARARSRESSRASERRSVRWARFRTAPRKSTSTRSQLRRPILRPSEKAPSGSSDIGIVGWPTRPRSGASRLRRPSACSRFMIAEVDCTESPVSLATSILDRGPKRRTSESSRRSL